MEKEKRLASALITIEKCSDIVGAVNKVLSEFSTEILARQGLSMPRKDFNIISIILETDVDTINSLAGKLGRIKGVCIKILMTKEQ